VTCVEVVAVTVGVAGVVGADTVASDADAGDIVKADAARIEKTEKARISLDMRCTVRTA
jgi:hypothetical protein